MAKTEQDSSSTSRAQLLIAYDGSPSADAALAHATRLFAGSQATVLTVWSTLSDYLNGRVLGAFARMGTIVDDPDDEQGVAEKLALRAAEKAEQEGLKAHPLTRQTTGAVWPAILATATAIRADVIVCGSRGHGEAHRLLLGSVSHALVQHADRPVMVTPSVAVADLRVSAMERLS